MHGLVSLPFGSDGVDHDFRLTLSCLIAVEDETGEAITVTAAKLHTATATTKEIMSVLVWGLVGSGRNLSEARDLVRLAFDAWPRDGLTKVAYMVAVAGLSRAYSPSLSGEAEAPASQSGSTLA
ncbi:hypothetical protein M2360_000928 [Rhizobium sp. SG_E_25_P2]|uniref:GTA-gp10 family protein n=1 Tax=Rhizobium sp. SG_E_25_P2 TaxID=2879942 RepID=UPI0024735EC2|nr:GTA-gp10 family protein [Rhizobium sp. SG_E_25_P2]MDH6265538.1 hypothetical protein [Rhizobium sp. SG_E_25_P2]